MDHSTKLLKMENTLPQDYQTWSARQKQEFIWEEKIIPSQYKTLPALKKIDVAGLFLTLLRVKMDCQADEAPHGWKKAIHAHGSVAKVKFNSTENTPFTGLFKGADYGLLRLSLTGDPADRGFAPGLALKLFIDGQKSANFSALVSLSGQGNNYNFFANELSNIVPEERSLGPKLINLIFRRVTKFPRKLYLQDFGIFNQYGQKETNPYYPWRLFLVPNPDLKFSSTPHDFRNDLATIAPGTKIFDVYAVNPSQLGDQEAVEEAGQIEEDNYRRQAQLIGSLSTTSDFICSDYGDRQLFFRHQRFANR